MLTREWLKAFLPIGVLGDQDRWTAVGAGFLFHSPPVLWIVTAAHVLQQHPKERIAILVDLKAGGFAPVDIGSFHAAIGVNWVLDLQHDIGIGLMPALTQLDIKAVSKEVCLPLAETIASMQCFTVGCPYGMRGFDPRRATPLVQDGIISGVDEGKKLLYITTPTFPGNSGGPVIAVRPPYGPAGELVVGRPTALLAGIVSQYGVVRPSHSNLPDALPGLHLGIAAATDVLLTLLESDEAKREIEAGTKSATKP